VSTITTTAPLIYVASLSDYNAGRLHGVHIDATLDIDDIWSAINDMLAASPEFRSFPAGGPAEEFAIHDHEGFLGLSIGEYDSIERVHAIAVAITEHGAKAAAFIAMDSDNVDKLDDIDDYCAGEYDSPDAYRAELFEELTLAQFTSELAQADKRSFEPRALVRFFEESIAPYIDIEAASAHGYDDDVEFVKNAESNTVFVFRYEI